MAALAGAAALLLPHGATAQPSAADQLYAELAKLPAAERQKRIEEGARKEGKLVLIHTMRGNLSVDHVASFKKRFPFLTVELEGDIGSQDAAERLYAEETAGRHLTDVINVALPDLGTLTSKNMLARFATPTTAAILPRSEEHTSEPQSRENLVCRLLLEKKKNPPAASACADRKSVV